MFDIAPNWHPIFVHFTVALLSVSFMVFIVGLIAKSSTLKEQAFIVARWNFWMAVVVTVATVIAGWLAYNSVAHDTPSHAAMTEHKNWALLTFSILLVVAAASWWRRGAVKLFGIGLLTVVAFLSITAWHGGELVYRYGLGVMSMPMMEGNGDAAHGEHAHGVEKNDPVQTEMQKNQQPQEEKSYSDPHDKPHDH